MTTDWTNPEATKLVLEATAAAREVKRLKEENATLRSRGYGFSCSHCGELWNFYDEKKARDAFAKEHIKTCPAHPMRGLETANAALLRQIEEMGVRNSELEAELAKVRGGERVWRWQKFDTDWMEWRFNGIKMLYRHHDDGETWKDTDRSVEALEEACKCKSESYRELHGDELAAWLSTHPKPGETPAAKKRYVYEETVDMRAACAFHFETSDGPKWLRLVPEVAE